MYYLIFYVPASHLDDVKLAVFEAGGGRLGHYQQCAWQTLGHGQFMPKQKATPYIGNIDVLSEVEEYRVEIAVAAQNKDACEAALRLSHPYETPAYYFVEVYGA